MDINTRDISYFLAIARTGSLTAAARDCHVSEAALSKAMTRVEVTVGFPLFERSKKGMFLTQAGAALHEHAVRIRRAHDDAMIHAADLRSGVAGYLRVGSTRPVFDGFVSGAIAMLAHEQPKLQIRVLLDVSSVLTTMLEIGQLDLVLVPLVGPAPRQFDVEPIGHDELSVVARSGHPYFAGSSRTMRDLLNYAWIVPPRSTAATTWLEGQFAAVGLESPRIYAEIDYAGAAVLDLAEVTDLILLSPGTSPAHEQRKGLRRIPLPKLFLRRPIYALSRRGCYWSLSMRALLRALSKGGGAPTREVGQSRRAGNGASSKRRASGDR